MKKILLSLSVVALSSSALISQDFVNKGHKTAPGKYGQSVQRMTRGDLSVANRATTITSQRVNGPEAIEQFNGFSSPYLLFTNPHFPDSNVMIGFTAGASAAFFHSFGQVFDLDGLSIKTVIFNPNVLPFDVNTDFTIDSIDIYGSYNRIEVNPAVVDTAWIQVVSGNGNFTRGFDINNPDSAKYVIDLNNVASNRYKNTIFSVKIPLDQAFADDTITTGFYQGLHKLHVGTPISVTGAHRGLVYVAMNYIPGRTLSQANDTAFVNTNSFSMLAVTPGGEDATYPNGFGEDYTIGEFIDGNVVGSGLDYSLPATAFIGDHPYQGYDMDIFVTQSNALNASIAELNNGAKLFQNYPNPTNGLTTVRYELANNAAISFEVMDITGKVVLSSFEGNKSEGVHTIEVNTNNLKAGVYFYSVSVNGNKLTNKMTVTK